MPVSAARWPQICFATFIWQKNHEIVNNTATTEAKEKINTCMESLEFQKFCDVCLTKFKSDQILLNKISHRFLVATKWVIEPHFSL